MKNSARSPCRTREPTVTDRSIDTRTDKPAVAACALFLLLAASLLFFAACKPSREPRRAKQGRVATQNQHERAAEIEPRLVELRYARVMERAGGFSLWLKEPREIVVERHATETVVNALRSQAREDRLRIEVQNGAKGAETREISLFDRKEKVCWWRLRQVPRLRRATIIIDDMGQNLTAARRLLALPYALTFSVLPDLHDSVATADAVHGARREVMLHLPMQAEPHSAASAGANSIRVGMDAQEVSRLIAADLASVPYATGVNNHMGSRATADPALMREVMSVLAARRLYFIDSRTTPETCALDAARAARVPSFYRAVFLDDTESVDYTLAQLRHFQRIVERQGVALAIGHPHATTIEALARFLPEFERTDIELVPPSELVRLPEAARLSPPPRRAPSRLENASTSR